MASIRMLVTLTENLTLQESLSGVFGSISLTTWIFLLVPQLIQNYKQGNADGISLAFLFVWLLGDICNLAGAAWAGLVPTVILLAIYFCFADFVLISQCLYYNYATSPRANLLRQESTSSAVSEDEPLLARLRSNDTLGLPGSHRRRSSARSERRDSLSKILEEDEEGSGWKRNVISITGIILVGAGGWAIAWRSGAWKPQPQDGVVNDLDVALGAEILGYASAIAYLGARIPQIIKNYKDKSCEGLSLLFFLLSLMGNATYGLGILFHSQQKEYILTNLPWLIGSLGTMFEDTIIFYQFRLYKTGRESAIEN